MKRIVLSVAVLLLASTAQAQVTAGVYGGFTTPSPSQSTYMVMADYGTKFDVEPWVQSFGSLVQFGVDLMVTPVTVAGFGVGGTVGIYSNTRTERYGVAITVPGVNKRFAGGQFRVERTNDGQAQSVIYYNINITDKTYLQPWLIPAQGGSSWLIGVGHTFKQ